jgi:hypothetical protein
MKINIIIDGNYLLLKSVYVLFKHRNLYTDLPIILERDYKNLTNLYYFDNIYFISDSRMNWRKRVYKEYKATRKKNMKIEWETVYNIYDEFKDSIKDKKNCKVYQIDELEGDDLISYIVKQSNKEGYSNMIVANDSDLYQLIKYNPIDKYINFMYNFKYNDERLFLPQMYEKFIDDISKTMDVDDLFEDSNSDNYEFIDFFNSITSNKKVIEINYEKELFIKIIGHNKDNIKSIYMKGTRGIGKQGAEKIYDFYKDTYPGEIDFNSKEFKNRLIESIKYCKNIKTDELDDIMKTKLDLNLKLVKLDEQSTPDTLYDKMSNSINIQ